MDGRFIYRCDGRQDLLVADSLVHYGGCGLPKANTECNRWRINLLMDQSMANLLLKRILMADS